MRPRRQSASAPWSHVPLRSASSIVRSTKVCARGSWPTSRYAQARVKWIWTAASSSRFASASGVSRSSARTGERRDSFVLAEDGGSGELGPGQARADRGGRVRPLVHVQQGNWGLFAIVELTQSGIGCLRRCALRVTGGCEMAVEVEIDVEVLKSEIKKTYAS